MDFNRKGRKRILNAARPKDRVVEQIGEYTILKLGGAWGSVFGVIKGKDYRGFAPTQQKAHDLVRAFQGADSFAAKLEAAKLEGKKSELRESVASV